jgi:Nif-specific regulatory protein
MGTKLVAISGPLKGTLIPLTEEHISIGRSQDNRICLKSEYASRYHCVIEQDADKFKIRDLGSYNGTMVNDLPVKEHWLDHGDQVRIGGSILLFLLRDEEAPSPDLSVEHVADDVTVGTTVELPIERVVHLQSPEAPETDRPAELRLRDMEALFKISLALISTSDMETLQRELLQSIVDLFEAERGAICLTESDGEGIASLYGWHKGAKASRPVKVNQSIVHRVQKEGIAILVDARLESEGSARVAKRASSTVASVLAVPLAVPDRRFGAIYLDSGDPESRFDKGDLELLTVIAGIAGVAVDNARRIDSLKRESRRLLADGGIKHSLVGESTAMRKVHEFIAKIAPTDTPVLVTGESGTGKELVVRAIHENSRRAEGPFVVINCTALVETLFESELFGHERGAFTGAIAQKKGKFEVANGGTIFLDEVGDLSPILQSKLLRVLQEHEFERVGGTRPIKCDVRVVAATNRDLKEAVSADAFREDLYYRLNEDIPLFTNYFAVKYGAKCNRRVWGVSDEALRCLEGYSWPGNVRELENAIEHAVVLGSGDLILPEELPESVIEAQPAGDASPTAFHEATLEAKKQIVLRAFRKGNGSFVEAARLLGIHPRSLSRMVRNMNLKETLKEFQQA